MKANISRYEALSFRSAVSSDENFVWCQNCDFGQLHASGDTQPIIRCLNCNFRSCFRHSVPWHHRLTCEEYDDMLEDPDNFQSAVDRDDETMEVSRRKQHDEDEAFARGLEEEQDRQKQIHVEQLRKARAEQEAAADKLRMKLELQQERDALKKRVADEKASLAKVKLTTKNCPGCKWPIEKNEGCAHMTCKFFLILLQIPEQGWK